MEDLDERIAVESQCREIADRTVNSRFNLLVLLPDFFDVRVKELHKLAFFFFFHTLRGVRHSAIGVCENSHHLISEEGSPLIDLLERSHDSR